MTSREMEKERNHDEKMIQNTDARPLIPLFQILISKTYAYLICQGPLWEDMDAHRGDIHVRVTKSHYIMGETRRSCSRMYRNSAQTGTERKHERERGNERRYEHLSEDKR